ncbi:MAG TPA: potassium channel family protein [Acidimicrobiales bacterium]|nr:potassium channel family protein [Acidimicrobiales bacterium]
MQSTAQELEVAAARDAGRFGAVLALLLATFLVLATSPTGRFATIVTTMLQATTLVTALYAARAPRRLFRLAVVVSLLSVAFTVVLALAGSGEQRDASLVVDLLLVGAAPAVIVAGIVRRRKVDVQTVLGALCIYILIGMFWAFLYATIGALGSAPFFAQTPEATTANYLYFSFVTLTTTGYGDFTAAGDFGRSVAVLEALLGQLYLVTVVAVLVSNLVPRNRG